MSYELRGTVNEITTKAIKSKAGKNLTLYYASVLSDGEDAEIILVNLGFKKPVYKDGDRFEERVDMDKYGETKIVGYYTASTSTLTGSAPASPVPRITRDVPKYPAKVFPVPKDSGEFAIIRQSALKAAIDTMIGAGGATVLGCKNVDEFSDRIIDLAYKYTDFSSGHREIKFVEEQLKDKKDSK